MKKLILLVAVVSLIGILIHQKNKPLTDEQICSRFGKGTYSYDACFYDMEVVHDVDREVARGEFCAPLSGKAHEECLEGLKP
jgi:hypothetical protein